MKKLLIVCAALCLAATAADAKERRHERGHDRDHECKDSVKAAGEAALRVSKAERNAVKSWQEQVINLYGERYINFDNARVVERHCNPARVGGTMGPLHLKRCVIVARPCQG